MKEFLLSNLRELSTEEQLMLSGGENVTGKCSCTCNCPEGKNSDTKDAIADGVKKSLN